MANDNMNNEGPVIVEGTYAAPIAAVWAALTDVNQMRQWYFDVDDFRPEPGFEFQFYGGKDDERWLHLCKVTTVEPGRKVAYTWRYQGYEGNTEVTFELSTIQEGTKLVITHEGLDTLPPLADFAKDNFVGGWTYFAGKALPEFLARNVA